MLRYMKNELNCGMTMVATTYNDDNILLILGDMLVSSLLPPDHFLLPMLFSDVLPHLPSSAAYRPVDLMQKIYILKNNVCLIFAGSLDDFEPLLEDLILYCRCRAEVSGEELDAHVKQFSLINPIGDISVMILVLQKLDGKPGARLIPAGDWVTGKSSLIGNITAAGSGAKDFIALSQLKSNTLIEVAVSDPLGKAILANVVLLTRILAQERAVLSTVKAYWGGGFEVAYIAAGAFHKLDDITYIIYQGQFDEADDIETPVPALILHYKYYGDTLVMTSLTAPRGSIHTTDTHHIFRYMEFIHHQYNVKPLLPVNGIGDVPEDPSFVSTRVAVGYILNKGDGDFIPASLHFEHDLKVEYQHGKNVTITMSKEMMETAIQQVKGNITTIHG